LLRGATVTVTRLTHHSSNDVPQAFTPDGREVLFTSNRLGDAKASALDGAKDLGGAFEQLYSIPAQGGRPLLVLPFPALEVAPSADGQRLLYTDRRSTENEWRKHHVSDAARDVWLYDRQAGTHRRLSEFRGEDRNAIWTPQQDAFHWLSEQGGSFNVWRRSIGGGNPQQVTFHKDHPVRFLSGARDGSLVYGFDGEIWRLPAGTTQPQRVPVQIRQADLMAGPSNVNLTGLATELAVSPTAPEYALIARGEVFVVSALSGVTRRITDTPAEERHLSYTPDGRSLIYASERNGRWEVMESRLRRADDTGFAGAAPFTENVLIVGEGDAFQPVVSPDGRRIAYRQDRANLRVYDRQTRRSVQVLGKESVYSYTDDDLNFAWAPDGRWLVSRTGFEGTAEIELIDAMGQQPRRNISRSGFMDMRPQVSADGSAVLWLSDRAALRTADSNPAALDVWAAFLTPEAFDTFRATPDERARLELQRERQVAARAITGPGSSRRLADVRRHRAAHGAPHAPVAGATVLPAHARPAHAHRGGRRPRRTVGGLRHRPGHAQPARAVSPPARHHDGHPDRRRGGHPFGAGSTGYRSVQHRQRPGPEQRAVPGRDDPRRAGRDRRHLRPRLAPDPGEVLRPQAPRGGLGRHRPGAPQVPALCAALGRAGRTAQRDGG
jgi:tricorn protease